MIDTSGVEIAFCYYCMGWSPNKGDGRCIHCQRGFLDISKMAKCPATHQHDRMQGGRAGCPACHGSDWVDALD